MHDGFTGAPGAERLAAEIYLRALKAAGVDAFYGVAGTDFPSIVEAFAGEVAGEAAGDMPEPVLVPHENLAASMAHGHAMITGKAQAVMVHVSVGTANIICGAMNAWRDRVPMLLSAGRTPVTENGPPGTRSRYIHWAQEMFDQGAMLREAVKWDYELRHPDQVADVARRAVEIAHAAPAGPVYLSLPREHLAARSAAAVGVPCVTSRPAPEPAAVDRLAEMIRRAESPVIVTSYFGQEPGAVPLLEALAEAWALPVVGMSARRAFLPPSHPMHMGFAPDALLREADLILCLDCEVPWIPAVASPPAGVPMVQLGIDPLAAEYPLRGFAAELSVIADSGLALAALGVALGAPSGAAVQRVEARRARLAERRRRDRERWAAEGARDELTPQTLSAALRAAIPEDAIVCNEYPLRMEQFLPGAPGTFFGLSPAGGLGWGLGAALGAKKAAPERMAVAVLGDGAYMFNNPTACHFVSEASKLPVLSVIFNNRCWGAVRNSTLALHGQGAAAAGNGMMLADLNPAPKYEKIVEAHDGLGLRAETLEEAKAAIDRGLEAVAGGRQAVVNVLCDY